MKLTIYSKKDCHLCEEAKAILFQYARRYPLEIQEVDIEKDPEIYQKYRDQIPVIFLEDRKLFKYRIDEKKLIRAIESELHE